MYGYKRRKKKVVVVGGGGVRDRGEVGVNKQSPPALPYSTNY